MMIRLYCRRRLHVPELPPEYAALVAYARQRLSRCRYGSAKPACRRCPTHCYAPRQRAMIRAVMRWAGPRMFFYHPLITLRHYLRG